MSCDNHGRTCPRYSPKEYSSQVSKGFEKYNIDRLSRGQAWSYGWTGGQTDRRTGAGNNNAPLSFGLRGKNTLLRMSNYTDLHGCNHLSMPNSDTALAHLIGKISHWLCFNGITVMTWFADLGMNSSPPGQNGRHSTDDIFRCIFVNEKFCILVKISLKFATKGPIDNIPALV